MQRARHFQRFFPGVGTVHLVTLHGQENRDRVRAVMIVIGDENAPRGNHFEG